jgi:hypothetical protein
MTAAGRADPVDPHPWIHRRFRVRRILGVHKPDRRPGDGNALAGFSSGAGLRFGHDADVGGHRLRVFGSLMRWTGRLNDREIRRIGSTPAGALLRRLPLHPVRNRPAERIKRNPVPGIELHPDRRVPDRFRRSRVPLLAAGDARSTENGFHEGHGKKRSPWRNNSPVSFPGRWRRRGLRAPLQPTPDTPAWKRFFSGRFALFPAGHRQKEGCFPFVFQVLVSEPRPQFILFE